MKKLMIILMFGWTLQAHGVVTNATWLGGAGNWNVSANWSTTSYPNNNAGTQYVVFIDSGNAVASVVTQNVSVTINALDITAGDQLRIADAITLTVSDGTATSTITNRSIIALNSTGNLTNLRLQDGTVLAGGGTISLGNHANNRIYGVNGAAVITNLDNTIEGAGQICVATMGLDNRGTITANLPALMVVRPTAGLAVVNTGFMQATNGATLRLYAGTFTNQLGTIRAWSSSTVEVSFATIAGGTITSAGSGVVRAIDDSVLSNVTVDAQFEVVDGAVAVDLSGVISNRLVMALQSLGTLTDFRILGSATLAGGGKIVMGNHANNRVYGITGTEVLTNADNVIEGAGQIGVNRTKIVNLATITANQSVRLVIDPGDASPFINEGSLAATNGATLRLSAGVFTNSLGTISAANASTVELSSATIAGGVINTVGSGVVRAIAASVLTNVTLTGALEVANGVAVDLAGVISNQSVMTLLSLGSLTDFRILGSATLAGGGTISMGNDVRNRIYGVASGETLINADNTIIGAGEIGENRTKIINDGTIHANQPTQLTIDPQDALGFVNHGILVIDAGRTMEVTGGGFSNFVSSTGMLTGGTYRVAGAFKFTDAGIVNNAATILLAGAGSAILNHLGANALANFATNTAPGSFTIQNGRSHSLSNAFVNYGVFHVATTDSALSVGQHRYTQAAGKTAINSGLILGDFGCSITGVVEVIGGNLYVTNSTASATLEIRSGTLTLSAGALTANKLVITNACGRFIYTGGSLVANVVAIDPNQDTDGDGLPNGFEQSFSLDPFDPRDAVQDDDGDGQPNIKEILAGTNPGNGASVFRIIGINPEGNNLRVTWSMGAGKTNALQRSSDVAGSYGDIFTVTNTTGTVTNYLDAGGATTPARYYRVRLVTPP